MVGASSTYFAKSPVAVALNNLYLNHVLWTMNYELKKHDLTGISLPCDSRWR